MTNTRIDGTEATHGGGFFSYNAKQVALNDCTVTNCAADGGEGGGICNRASEYVLNGSTIENCTANSSYGGGVYVQQYSGLPTAVTLIDSTVKDCTSKKDGGGVYMTSGSVHVAGDTKIAGNTMTGGAANDLRLANDKDCLVVDGDLGGNADIRISNTTNPGTEPMTQIGTYVKNAAGKAPANLDTITSNAKAGIYAMPFGGSGVVWNYDAAGKVTDANDHLLYRRVDSGEAIGPAVYGSLEDALAGAAGTLYRAVDQSAVASMPSGTLYDENGEAFTVTNGVLSKNGEAVDASEVGALYEPIADSEAVKVKVLKEALKKSTCADWRADFLLVKGKTRSHTLCISRVLQRRRAENMPPRRARGFVQRFLKDVTLTEGLTINPDIENKTPRENVTLTTAETSLSAPTLDPDDTYIFHTDRTGEDSDKALIVRGFDGGSLITTNGAVSLTDIVLDGNKGANTGNDGGLVNVASGVTDDGKLDTTSGNFKTGELTEGQTNGGKAYTKARQDIYVVGGSDESEPMQAILIVDDLTNEEAGSIWVWAEESARYQEKKQFAYLDHEGITGLDAFRNAREDQLTSGRTRNNYLTGVVPDDDTTGRNVCWGAQDIGSRKVILRKVTQSTRGDLSLSGATFLIEGTGFTGDTFTSDQNGIFWVGTLTYGVYYFKELAAPEDYEDNEGMWFCVIVDELGAHVSDVGCKGAGDELDRAAAFAKAQAVRQTVEDAVVTA